MERCFAKQKFVTEYYSIQRRIECVQVREQMLHIFGFHSPSRQDHGLSAVHVVVHGALHSSDELRVHCRLTNTKMKRADQTADRH